MKNKSGIEIRGILILFVGLAFMVLSDHDQPDEGFFLVLDQYPFFLLLGGVLIALGYRKRALKTL